MSLVPPLLPFALSLRNVTIRGRAGADTPVELDLAYKHAGVVLCHSCRVTIQDLTLTDARRGTGSALDYIVGEDGVGAAAVVLQDVRRHRLACTPSSSLQEVLEATPRSKILPPSSTGEQMFALKTVTDKVRLPAGADRSPAWLGAASKWESCWCCSGLHKLGRDRQLSVLGGPGVGIGMARCNISRLCAGAAGHNLPRHAAPD